VATIRWKRHAVEAITADGNASEARAAIVTVPLGVLQAPAGARGSLRFSPSLTDKQHDWGRLGFGHALRIVVCFSESIWRQNIFLRQLRSHDGRGFGFVHSAEVEFPVWWSLAPAPVLIGWTGGPAAQSLASLSNREISRRAFRTLATLLGVKNSALAEAIVSHELYNWTQDPYSRGAYSFSTAGHEDGPARLARPVEKTLFFAGEATAEPLHLGTVHGALASGERAAEEAMRALRISL
jgi:monoamine oxidase